jgi:hypothetical protein
MHLVVSTSLQRRCKLAEGWMNKPIWKQVSQHVRSIFRDKLSSEYDLYVLHLANVMNVLYDFLFRFLHKSLKPYHGSC